MKIKGTRVEVTDCSRLNDGEYAKINGEWYCKPPGSHLGRLKGHKVVEHEDGTITASPSILINWGEKQWHGYLIRGEWESC